MSQLNGLNRRAFLRNAGLTALAGAAAGTHAPLSPRPQTAAALQVPSNGTFDFDTVYNRFGTDSTKFDQQIRVYGKDSVQVGMGIADIDFKAAPVDHQRDQRAREARELGLPRHGQVDAAWSPTPSRHGTSAATA